MTSKQAWGKLILSGGEDADQGLISEMSLIHDEHYFGRLEKTATGISQLLISKPYVSGTHFLIRKVEAPGVNHFVRDFGTNGTFLNGELIGKDNERILSNDDIISISQQRIRTNDITTTSSDINGDVLAKQVAALQQENQQQEQRFATCLVRLETSRQEIFQLQKELRASVASGSSMSEELQELKNHCTSLEANAAAASARAHQLEDREADKIAALEEKKALLASTQEELAYRSNQLESRVKMLDDANAAIANERHRRQRVEEQLQLLHVDLEGSKEREQGLLQNNAVLRSCIEDQEHQLATAKTTITKLFSRLEQCRDVESNRRQQTLLLLGKLTGCLQECNDAVNDTSTLMSSDDMLMLLTAERLTVNDDNGSINVDVDGTMGRILRLMDTCNGNETEEMTALPNNNNRTRSINTLLSMTIPCTATATAMASESLERVVQDNNNRHIGHIKAINAESQYSHSTCAQPICATQTLTPTSPSVHTSTNHYPDPSYDANHDHSLVTKSLVVRKRKRGVDTDSEDDNDISNNHNENDNGTAVKGRNIVPVYHSNLNNLNNSVCLAETSFVMDEADTEFVTAITATTTVTTSDKALVNDENDNDENEDHRNHANSIGIIDDVSPDKDLLLKQRGIGGVRSGGGGRAGVRSSSVAGSRSGSCSMSASGSYKDSLSLSERDEVLHFESAKQFLSKLRESNEGSIDNGIDNVRCSISPEGGRGPSSQPQKVHESLELSESS
eukprot:gene7083-14414_t